MTYICEIHLYPEKFLAPIVRDRNWYPKEDSHDFWGEVYNYGKRMLDKELTRSAKALKRLTEDKWSWNIVGTDIVLRKFFCASSIEECFKNLRVKTFIKRYGRYETLVLGCDYE